eukprot:13996245-Alexandrium_andersonii.AAC.1
MDGNEPGKGPRTVAGGCHGSPSAMAHRCCGGVSGATGWSAVPTADTNPLSGAWDGPPPLPLEETRGQLGPWMVSERAG